MSSSSFPVEASNLGLRGACSGLRGDGDCPEFIAVRVRLAAVEDRTGVPRHHPCGARALLRGNFVGQHGRGGYREKIVLRISRPGMMRLGGVVAPAHDVAGLDGERGASGAPLRYELRRLTGSSGDLDREIE